MMRSPLLAFLGAIGLSAGCSTEGTSIILGDGQPLPATDPATVHLLLEPPPNPHKVLALVEGVAATDDYFTKAKTEAAAIKAMKDEAARIGAHAIVLTGKGSQPYGETTIANTYGSATSHGGSVSGYATTTSAGLGFEKITFSGTAIVYEKD